MLKVFSRRYSIPYDKIATFAIYIESRPPYENDLFRNESSVQLIVDIGDKRYKTVTSPSNLDMLMELIEEVKDGGHRTLIFSQFTSMLAIIRSQLEEFNIPFLYMDGETKDRLELTQKFNTDPSITCFLISLKTGGHGLNLTGADTVIHYDQWWNPAVEAQATDRAHRIAQTKSVTVYKLICKQTIEEKIMELQNKKRELFTSLVDDDASSLSLTAEDITEILSY